MKTLHIVESAYRATLEEQDDTVIWAVHAMANAGAQGALLLRGSAVNYGHVGQDASGLEFGDVAQGNPPDIAKDLIKLADKGFELYYLEDDLLPRGLSSTDLLPILRPIGRGDLPELFDEFEQVWHW